MILVCLYSSNIGSLTSNAVISSVLTKGFASLTFFINSIPESFGIFRSDIMRKYSLLLFMKCSKASTGSVNDNTKTSLIPLKYSLNKLPMSNSSSTTATSHLPITNKSITFYQTLLIPKQIIYEHTC